MASYINLSLDEYTGVKSHLLSDSNYESAAFIFVRPDSNPEIRLYRCVELFLVPQTGYQFRSGYHLELAEHIQSQVIKRAHDLDASLVEMHSHIGDWPARFSESDFNGFNEFVPHVLWRLKGAPYFAVVMTKSGFDGIAWFKTPQIPVPLDGIIVDERLINSTGLSIGDKSDGQRIVQ